MYLALGLGAAALLFLLYRRAQLATPGIFDSAVMDNLMTSPTYPGGTVIPTGAAGAITTDASLAHPEQIGQQITSTLRATPPVDKQPTSTVRPSLDAKRLAATLISSGPPQSASDSLAAAVASQGMASSLTVPVPATAQSAKAAALSRYLRGA